MVSILRNGLLLRELTLTRRMHSPFNIHLTGASVRGSLRGLFLRLHYVKDLRHHRIESDAR
jgi:hypothetical protein